MRIHLAPCLPAAAAAVPGPLSHDTYPDAAMPLSSLWFKSSCQCFFLQRPHPLLPVQRPTLPSPPQLLLSLGSSVISYVWRETVGMSRPHLALDDPVQASTHGKARQSTASKAGRGVGGGDEGKAQQQDMTGEQDGQWVVRASRRRRTPKPCRHCVHHAVAVANALLFAMPYGRGLPALLPCLPAPQASSGPWRRCPVPPPSPTPPL